MGRGVYKRWLSSRGVVSVVVGVAVIVAIVAVGLMASASQHSEKSAGTSAKNTAVVGQTQSTDKTSSTPSTSSTTTNTATPETASAVSTADGQYLEIKEWGIKLPISGAIKDAYYTFKGGSIDSDGMQTTAWLGVTTLNASGCNVAKMGPTATANPLGSIVRVTPTESDPVTGKLYTKERPDGVTIGKYYYGFASWTNSCTSAATLSSINQAFDAAANNAVSDTSN